jgi:HAMP domain-containing protein
MNSDQELLLGRLRDIQRLAKEAEEYVLTHYPTVAVAAGNIAASAISVAQLAGRLEGVRKSYNPSLDEALNSGDGSYRP